MQGDPGPRQPQDIDGCRAQGLAQGTPGVPALDGEALEDAEQATLVHHARPLWELALALLTMCLGSSSRPKGCPVGGDGRYGQLPAAFGATDRAQGQLFATLASLALDSAEQRDAREHQALQLTEALKTREVIGQAQGILMERERITADQAFDVLRRASQRMNVKPRVVASTLVETGEDPGAPTS